MLNGIQNEELLKENVFENICLALLKPEMRPTINRKELILLIRKKRKW